MQYIKHNKSLRGWNDKRHKDRHYKAIEVKIGEHDPSEIDLIHKRGRKGYDVYQRKIFIGRLEENGKYLNFEPCK